MGWPRQTLENIYRILDKLQPDENGCMDWPGPHPGHPYQVRIDGRLTYVSRIVLERKLGRTILPDFLACHTCDNRSCANSEHIYEGTDKQNKHDIRDRQPDVWAARLNDLSTWAKSEEGRRWSQIQGMRNKGRIPHNKRISHEGY